MPKQPPVKQPRKSIKDLETPAGEAEKVKAGAGKEVDTATGSLPSAIKWNP